MSDSESLLPNGPNAFAGYRLLQEYFAFPNRFLFVEMADIGTGVAQCASEELEVVVALDRHDESLESWMTPSRMHLFCAPAVNLFPKTADRIRTNDSGHEYHVVADSTRPWDYEVHSVREVTGLGAVAGDRREFAPRHRSHGPDDAAFFTVQRRPRPSTHQRKASSARLRYAAEDVYVTLVDRWERPFRSGAGELAIETLCTNSDLPLYMAAGTGRTDFAVGSGAPVTAVRCVAGPSPPRSSQAFGGMRWRIIDHLSVNYLILSDTVGGNGAQALRNLLQLYEHLGEAPSRRQVDGVRSVGVRPAVRRLSGDGPPMFARGVEITLECDEAAFDGRSAFVLGSVLDHFFSRYVSRNSFTETILRSVERQEIARWPQREGGLPSL